MHDAVQHWDLSSMGFEELCSKSTVLFVAKVIAAASLVAFGPALLLEYVPTKKVDVGDMTSAGSKAGRTQRLLLAFAAGGLMAEAALHLLPHLFFPPHDSSACGEKHDSHHHDNHGSVDVYTLIAVGFLAAFAIDRFVGGRRQQAEGKTLGSKEIGVAVSAAVAPAGAGAAAEGISRGRKIEEEDAGVGDGEAGGEGPPEVVVAAADAAVADEAASAATVADEATVTVAAAVVGAADDTSSASAAEGDGDNGGSDVAEDSPATGGKAETATAINSATVVDENSCVTEDKDDSEVTARSLTHDPGERADLTVLSSVEGAAVADDVDGAAVSADKEASVAVAAAATAEDEEEEVNIAPLEAVASNSAEHKNSAAGTPVNSPTAGVCTNRAAAFGAPDGAYQLGVDALDEIVEKKTATLADIETEGVGIESGDDQALAPELVNVAKTAEEPAGPMQSGRHVEPTESSKPAQSVESAEPAELAEPEEHKQPEEPKEPVELVEPAEPAESAEVIESAQPSVRTEPDAPGEPAKPAVPAAARGGIEGIPSGLLFEDTIEEPIAPDTPGADTASSESTATKPSGLSRHSNPTTTPGEVVGKGDGLEADALATTGTSGHTSASANTSDDVATTGHVANVANTAVGSEDGHIAEDLNGGEAAATSPMDTSADSDSSGVSQSATGSTGAMEEAQIAPSSADPTEEPNAPGAPFAAAACSEPAPTEDLGLTRYGNPRSAPGEAAGDGEGLKAEEVTTDRTSRDDPAPSHSIDDVITTEHAAPVESGGGGPSCGGEAGHHDDQHGDHHGDHHDDHHGDAEAGAYVTLAVDFLHNVIDGIGIGGAYALGGDAAGHATAILKLIHEIQHEIGDVATLVQCGMSKHHAIHIQHTTAAGVFLGAAISLGASAFPEGLLSACLALSAGATFYLASGTVLGPVLAIPANVGGTTHAFLEVAALAAGAAGVVAVGVAEKWAGLGH